MDQPEVDAVDSQRSEARLERRTLPPGAARPQLRRHEDGVTRNPTLGQRTTNLLLVAIHAGRVDVPVAKLEGSQNSVPRALPTSEPRPKPEQRHAHTRRDLDTALEGHVVR